jgi:hypothetical protein
MLYWLLSLGVGALAVVMAYPKLARAGTNARLAASARAAGVVLIALLAFNAVIGPSRAVPPLVALDVSSSWLRGRDSAVFARARAAALDDASDSVLAFGDSVRRALTSTSSSDLASRVRPIAERAIAAGRPLILYTDGELDDPQALEGLPGGSRIELPEVSGSRDAAVAEVDAPRVSTSGDTVTVRVTVVASGGGAGAGRVALTLDGREVTGARLDSLVPFGERVLTLRFVAPAGAGDAVLTAVVESERDADARNNAAGAVLVLASNAAAVLVSSSPDLDSRELAALLRGTVSLPTRGYFRVAPGVWREEGTLASVSEETIRRAVREAPLVVLHGDTALFGPPRAATRGALALIAPPTGDPGEWFATGAPISPVASSLTGMPWDSLSPLEVSAAPSPNADFELLETRRARRLERRVAMVGWERPRRIVVVTASGFWRWRFRGGVGVDAFAAVWGSTLDWLAGEHLDVRRAIPAAASVRAGESVHWRRGSSEDTLVRAMVVRRRGAAEGSEAGAPDSTELALRFGTQANETESGALPAGVYDVRAPGGNSVLVVNPSAELVPRRPTVRAGAYGSAQPSGAAPRARDWPWLFGLALAALCAEWILRRRAGLR